MPFSTQPRPGQVRKGLWPLLLTALLAGLAFMAAFASLPAAAASVATGDSSSCALKKDGSVWCWGSSYYGLGDAAGTIESATPVRVEGLTGVTEVAAGRDFACAITGEANVVCWGDGSYGQLGDGSSDESAVPVPVSLLGNVRAIDAGERHVCALQRSGTVACWGDNSVGQLGDGTDDDRGTPTLVPGIKDAVDIATGTAHSCAASSSGRATCWGGNDYGQLGNGVAGGDQFDPVAVDGGLSDVVGITAGGVHSCALRTGGVASCWGGNDRGQLGDGTTDDRPTPTVVPGLSGMTAIKAGDTNTCGISGSGDVHCWGVNEDGQLGTATTDQASGVPVRITGVDGVIGISVGYKQICTASRNSPASSHEVIRCWGGGAQGQLGNGKYGSSATPSPVAGLAGLNSVAVGNYHSCALSDTGRVECWGNSRYGQLGRGRMATQPYPLPVPGVDRVKSISSGNVFTCAVRDDGDTSDRKITCWGDDYAGQLGIDKAHGEVSSGPVDTDLSQVLTNPDVRIAALVTGDAFTCALARIVDANYGEAWCWGRSDYGQSGGSASPPPGSEKTPVKVIRPTTPPLLLIRADQGDGPTIAAGGNHVCVVAGPVGNVWCWGRNFYGQLGDGTTNDRPRPRQVPGLSGVVSLAAGSNHTCARLDTGKVKCWGAGTAGQLGDGSKVSSLVPVDALVDDVKALAIRDNQTCAVLEDRTVSCWGFRFDGGFATAGTPGAGWAPSPVKGVSDVVSLSLGGYHACFADATGQASCWASPTQGYRYSSDAPHGDGEMPTGHYPVQRIPTAVIGFGPVAEPVPVPIAPGRPKQPLVELRDGKMRLRGLAVKKKGSHACPRKVQVIVSGKVALRKNGRKVAKTMKSMKSLKLKRQGATCRLVGVVKLKGRLARLKKVKLQVTGKGLKPIKRTVKAVWTAAIQGRKLKLDRAPVGSARPGVCPATATVVVSGLPRANSKHRKVLRGIPVGLAPVAGCQVTATLQLPPKLRRLPKLKITVKGSGLRPGVLSLRVR